MSPYTYLDMDKVEANIKWMQERLAEQDIEHWPHIKTHKSLALARKQLDAGAKGLTCSKPAEALVFAEAGLGPILIAYPVIHPKGLEQLEKIVKLTATRVTVDSEYAIEKLAEVSKSSGQTIEVLIDIDGGTQRTGVQTVEEAMKLANLTESKAGLKVAGVFTYFGLNYGMKTLAEVRADARSEALLLKKMKDAFFHAGINVSVTSGGSTLSSFHADQLDGMSQSRAGNYIFGDVNSIHHNIHKPEQCALRIEATVISTPVAGKATIDAGSKTLTSDLSVRNNEFGWILDKPGAVIKKLNEEHGYIEYDPKQNSFTIGETVDIIPNHSCIVTNLHQSIPYYRNGQYEGELSIDARGTS